MKQTVFYSKHEALGAKLAPFAGFNMPIQYEGLLAEHQHVRAKVGVFDVSHMGLIYVNGPKAFELVQYVTSNDLALISDGKVQYSCFPNDKGGIVDDFLIYQINQESYLLVVNASNIEKDYNWLQENNKNIGAEIVNESDNYSILAIQGPLAMATVKKLTNEPVEEMKYYTFKYINFAGIDNVLFSITGYTGEAGCEIYFKNEDADKIWDAVFEAGKEFDIKPVGLASRDTLRLEMGFCLYGNDIDDTTSPIEAGLGWITKFTENNQFVNRKYHEDLKANGVEKRLVGFEMIDRGIPRHGYEIADADGNIIGNVTSGTQGPSVGKSIGLGYVKREMAKADTEIYIVVRGKLLKAVTVKLPFYKS